MKLFKLILLLFVLFQHSGVYAQDPSIQVLTQNNGVVALGETVFLQVTVGNTLSTPVPANKIRVSVSAPASVSLNSAATQLPAGFIICSNAGGTMIISNGSTPILQSAPQTILVAMVGVNIAPSATVSGSMLAAGGAVPTRCNNGAPIPTNTTPNDNSTSTITVTGTVPLVLSAFTAGIVNCRPVLYWQTENEINSSHFEVEYLDGTAGWLVAGNITAAGTNSSGKYSFTDNAAVSAGKILYRLKIIDTDGSFKYSDVLPVWINCTTISANIFPNPVSNGKLHLSITGITAKAGATLTSITGQTILQTTVVSGTNIIDVHHVANGTYILNISEQTGITKKWKVIINN